MSTEPNKPADKQCDCDCDCFYTVSEPAEFILEFPEPDPRYQAVMKKAKFIILWPLPLGVLFH